MAPTPLGDYLRSRRALVTPADVGLMTSGSRRVAGLRREEVAMLAGVSVDYYVRLEQGRERSPSPQVLDALGAALRLDDDGRQHLYRLAGLAPRALSVSVPEQVDPRLLQLMDAWPDNPALVHGRAYDVLATNRIGSALFDGFAYSTNLMVKVFLDPASRSFYVDWRTIALNCVAGLRLSAGAAPDDPRVREVVRELLERSPEFAEMWAHHDARGKTLGIKTLRHSQVGELTLDVHTFDVRAAGGQQLVVYQAEPGSASADALRMLGTIAATQDRDASQAG